MRFWYFLFEGIFINRNDGVFSSAMLLSANAESAKIDLVKELEKEGITLKNIEDHFEFKISEIDFQNEDNLGWINMYEVVKDSGGCVFTPWQVFEIRN